MPADVEAPWISPNLKPIKQERKSSRVEAKNETRRPKDWA
jgi:hypothetical protein